jgi:hypothetical protein
MEREEPQGYDVLAIDAFSGDAIPVHLLTRECLAVYQRHLKADGILAIHISNRYLDLAPVVRAMARRAQMRVETFHYFERHEMLQVAPQKPPQGILHDTASEWMLVTKNMDFFGDEQIRQILEDDQIRYPDARPEDQRVIEWTDQYSNLSDILNW